jgi:hypothetical protein
MTVSDTVGFAIADAIVASGGEVFDPTSISDLAAWYDLSDVSSVAYDASTFEISQVNDLSGNDAHITNVDGPLPKYDHVDGYMHNPNGNEYLTADIVIPEEYTMVIAARYTDLSGGAAKALVGKKGSYGGLIGIHSGGTLSVRSAGVNEYVAATTDKVFLAGAYGLEGETASGWYNDTEYTGVRDVHGTFNSMSFFTGKTFCTANTRIYAAAIYNRKLGASEIAQLRDYFNA